MTRSGKKAQISDFDLCRIVHLDHYHGSFTAKELAKRLHKTDVKPIISRLRKEGLLKKDGRLRYTITERGDRLIGDICEVLARRR